MKPIYRFVCATTVALLLSPLAAFAASSGVLTLSGTVDLVNDIVITPNGTNNTSLDIVNGETAKLVASAAETSNNASGYTVEISSLNGGELRHATDASKKTVYQISYDAGTYAQPSVTPAAVKTVASLPGLTTDNSDINVNVTAFPSAIAGTYSDTVTIAISANP